MAEVQAVRVHGGDRKSEEFQGDNYHLEKNHRGTSTTYLKSKSKREKPRTACAKEPRWAEARVLVVAMGGLGEDVTQDRNHPVAGEGGGTREGEGHST